MEIKRSKYWQTMVDILDGQFPKHACRERGRALVMLAYLELMMQGMKFGSDGQPEKRPKKCAPWKPEK